MRALVTAVCVLLLAGCTLGGDGESTVEVGRLNSLVLQPRDVPRVFVRFDEGRQIRADAPGGERADPRRFGREEGWKARYRRGGSPTTRGPLVIESRIDLFRSAAGASDELDAHEDEAIGAGWSLVEEPSIGDEAFALTLLQPGGPGVRFYLVAWRDKNVTASLLVNGFERRIALPQILELARKQQRRIDQAAPRVS